MIFFCFNLSTYTNNMGIPIPGKDSLYIETRPWSHSAASCIAGNFCWTKWSSCNKGRWCRWIQLRKPVQLSTGASPSGPDPLNQWKMISGNVVEKSGMQNSLIWLKTSKSNFECWKQSTIVNFSRWLASSPKAYSSSKKVSSPQSSWYSSLFARFGSKSSKSAQWVHM